jgi:hypothetical protein
LKTPMVVPIDDGTEILATCAKKMVEIQFGWANWKVRKSNCLLISNPNLVRLRYVLKSWQMH